MAGKVELLADIGTKWTALGSALGQLTEAQMTTVTDAEGWTVKDHVIHLTAWMRSMVFFLQGRPRHAGLGVAEDLYLNGGFDNINAAIKQQNQHVSVDEAMAQLKITQRQLVEQIQLFTDADLQKPYRYFLPDEPGGGDGPVAIEIISGNSAEHFEEHLVWIESLLEQQSS
jgi:hypothetical protein